MLKGPSKQWYIRAYIIFISVTYLVIIAVLVDNFGIIKDKRKIKPLHVSIYYQDIISSYLNGNKSTRAAGWRLLLNTVTV